MRLRFVAGIALLLVSGCTTGTGEAPPRTELKLLGHHDLGGPQGGGKGGEGMAVVKAAGGKRILYTAAESGPNCFSAVDVTDPAKPAVVIQVDVPGPNTACNSLDISGHILAVANQTNRPGQKPAGLRLYDVTDPARPREAGFLDTSGPQSRGVHHVWFVDGRYAYLSTGAADFAPTKSTDDQFLMIVDLADPAQPREVGRWWYPGTREGDPVPSPPRNPAVDTGYRLHNVDVYPEHPDRAYLGYIDGGVVVLDISRKERPVPLFIGRFDPPYTVGFTHTVVPLFSRELLVVSSEAVTNNCAEPNKRIWLWNLKDDAHPAPLAPAPMPSDLDRLCQTGGRYGAHNLWENRPGDTGFHSERLVVGSFFAGGMRVYDTCDPASPREVAALMPPAPPGSSVHAIQINHIYWDDRSFVYGVDRFGGGLYVAKLQSPATSLAGCKSAS